MPADTNVFISYATDTKPAAEELTRALEQNGFHAWADFKDLQPGQRWKDQTEQALERAQFFLILVGPDSRTSQWQEWEWRAALEKVWGDSKKTLIPLIVGPGESPPFLRDWVSLRIDPVAEPAYWAKRVLQMLKTTRNRGAHGLTNEDRKERKERLSEIARAAEELGKREADPSR